MDILHLKKKRRKLFKITNAGTFESVVTKNFVTTGLVIPRDSNESIHRLLDAGLSGVFCVVWKDYLGGETCFRPLESKITPLFLLNYPDTKIRIQITDGSGEEQGFIEPELFYCFVPDWEERL